MRIIYILTFLLVSPILLAEDTGIKINLKTVEDSPQPGIPLSIGDSIGVFVAYRLTHKENELFTKGLTLIADEIEEDKLKNVSLDLSDTVLVFTKDGSTPIILVGDTAGANVDFCIYALEKLRMFEESQISAAFIEELVHHFWQEENEMKAKHKVIKIMNRNSDYRNLKFDDIYDQNGGLKSPKFTKGQVEKLATTVGAIYVNMPKETLYKVYTPLQQKGYRKIDNEEWITLSEWMTEEPGDKITFYLKDGKVKGWDRKD